MAEIIGTVASCVQLADCCIKITASIAEVCERVKGASERLERHTEQISHLFDTAILIKQSKLLQNAAVESHLIATLTEARHLQETLDDVAATYRRGFVRRYWEAIHGSRERKILTQFENLEQRKSALVLCINIVQSESLAGIECDVSRILSVVSEKTEKKTQTRWSVITAVGYIPPFRNTISSASDLEDKKTDSIREKYKQKGTSQHSISVSKAATEVIKRQDTFTMAPPVYRSTMPQDIQPVYQEPASQPAVDPYHTYQGLKIDSEKVINGNFYGDGKFRSPPQRTGSGNSYHDIETSSGGRVINGDVFNAPDFWK